MRDKEVISMTHSNTGTITDNLALGTSKPSSASESVNISLINTLYAQGKAPIKTNKSAVRTTLIFNNSGTASATVYYTIQIGTDVKVDGSAGTAIAGSGSVTINADFTMDTPSAGIAQIDIYAWASTTVPTLVSHEVISGIGTNSATADKVLTVLYPFDKNIAIDVTTSSGTATTTLKDGDGNELLTTTGDVNITNEGLVEIYLTAPANELAWIDRIMIRKI